jgi:peptidoglycan/LPS O-acetylase OafA/YrhL
VDSLKFKGHIPGLDVLRGLAIALVVVYHGVAGRVPSRDFSEWKRAIIYLTGLGAGGVHLFFVLSGFLITGIILDGRAKPTREFFSTFYERRALRILPAYFLVLIVLKALNIISWKFVLAAVLFIANMASAVGAHASEYGPLWSLAVEEQFYLIWPWLARRITLRKLAIFSVLVSVALILGGLLISLRYPRVDTATKFWNNAPWLLAGALIAIGLRDEFIRRDNIRRIIAACLIAAVVTSPIVYLDDWRGAAYLGPAYRVPFVLVFVAMLLLAIAGNTGDRPSSSLPARGLAFLGYLSYGLYLVHQLIFILFDRSFAGTWIVSQDLDALFISTLICFSVSVGVAYLSRRYFEEYFLRVGRRGTAP